MPSNHKTKASPPITPESKSFEAYLTVGIKQPNLKIFTPPAYCVFAYEQNGAGVAQWGCNQPALMGTDTHAQSFLSFLTKYHFS